MPKPRLTYSALFLKLAGDLDVDGFSRKVPVTEFTGEYARLRFNNGAGWARDDGPMGRKYNIARTSEGAGNAITHVQIAGLKKAPKGRQISARVQQALKGKPCVVLAVGARRRRVNIDHKDGRYDDARVADTAEQRPEDFQPVTECVNYAKRQHCADCAKTGERFDARRLGFTAAQTKGGARYVGSCAGCYWFDPPAFCREISRGFAPR